MRRPETLRLTVAGLLTAVGILLPAIFHHTPFLDGRIFLPMHIPILLAGILTGPLFGAISGAIVPIISSMVSGGRPPMFPSAVTMMFELATYGLVTGVLAKRFNVIITLVVAMIAGRIVLGIAQAILVGNFMIEIFIVSALTRPWPGIIVQIVLIPAIIQLLKRAKMFPLEEILRN